MNASQLVFVAVTSAMVAVFAMLLVVTLSGRRARKRRERERDGEEAAKT